MNISFDRRALLAAGVATLAAGCAPRGLAMGSVAAESSGDPEYYSQIGPQPVDGYLDYSTRDHLVVDYQPFQLPEAPGITFRGPAVAPDALATGNYFTCLGAAQTMGVYAPYPYPARLAERIGKPALNLGAGGAGPGFYLLHRALLDVVNRGKFVILQVMSARAEANSRLAPYGFAEMVRDRHTGNVTPSTAVWTRLLLEEREAMPRYVDESRDSLRRRYRDLLAEIRVPVLLFHFSPKPLDEPINYDAADVAQLMGRFPQLVDRATVEAISAQVQTFCVCDSDRGMNYPLTNRFTGEPTSVDHGALLDTARGSIETHNYYYPSAEMHADATDALMACLAGTGWLQT